MTHPPGRERGAAALAAEPEALAADVEVDARVRRDDLHPADRVRRAVAGRPAAGGAGAAAVRSAMIWARIEIATSPGVRAPMSRPAGVWICSRSASGTSSDAITARAARAARDERDVADAGLQRPRERLLLGGAVRGDDHRRVGPVGLDPALLGPDDVVAGRAGDVGQGDRDRGVPDHDDARRGQLRLEEDLERPAAEAGVVDDDDAVLGDRVVLAAPSAPRDEAQQQRVAGLQRPDRVQPDRRLRADAADEAVDGPVGAARARSRRAARSSARRRARRSRTRTARVPAEAPPRAGRDRP